MSKVHFAGGDKAAFIKASPKLKPSRIKISDLNWKFAVRSVLNGDNLLILGESGFGKTMLATILPEVLDRPFFNIPMGHTNDPKSLLIGNTHFSPEKGTYVVDSEFVRAIQTENAVILLDEFSRAHPSAHNILMPVLDKKQRRLVLDTREDTPAIQVAKGVSFIMTANVGSDYSATRSIDRAIMDRCMVLVMPMLTKDEEVELLTERYPELDSFTIQAIAEIAHETRQQVKSESPKLSTQVSTRVTNDMGSLICDGFTLDEAAQVFIYPLYSEAGGTSSERTYIKQKVQFYLDPTPTAVPAPWEAKNFVPPPVSASPAMPPVNPNGNRNKPFP